MTAQVVMTHDYPKVAPVFVVSVLWQHERTAANDKHVKVRTGHKEKLLKYNIINMEIYSINNHFLFFCFDRKWRRR